MSEDRPTYARSGAAVDAGNRLAELVKPLVQATARAGSDVEIRWRFATAGNVAEPDKAGAAVCEGESVVRPGDI